MKGRILYIAFLFLGVYGSNAQHKVGSSLYEQLDNSITPIPVIIHMQDQLVVDVPASIKTKSDKSTFVYNTLLQHSETSQKSICHWLEQQNIPYQSFWIFNGLALKADKALIDQLATRSDVSLITYNNPIALEETERSTLQLRSQDTTWGIKMIGADQVWRMGIKGAGVVVGGQDTGYKWDLDQLKSKYRGYHMDTVVHDYNWHDAISDYSPLHGDSINPCGLNLKTPCDDNNHGTHTMGTMIGSDTAVAIGVAPEAQWIGCRNMERGYGSPSTYTDCFQWFLAPTDLNGLNPRPELAPDVINNSWACPQMEGCNPDNFLMMQTVVDNLTAAGIFVVVSAGNSGPGCHSINSPAAIFDNSFTVGASSRIDSITNFSSRGIVTVDSSFRMKPNVVAPGAGVLSILPNGQMAAWNGTSMAGPHVAGAVALLISAVPELKGQVEIIRQILQETAVPKFSSLTCMSDSLDYPNPVFGYGRIDIKAAIDRAMQLVNVEEESDHLSDIKVYPNPAQDRIWISVPHDPKRTSNTTVQIVDLMGRQLLSMTNQGQLEEGIDISSLAAGVYVLVWQQAGLQWTIRFYKAQR